ncbi:MAG: MBL fold metallo-hydrolase [Candidatus Nezhaarchaeales archaeon]
MSCKAVEEGVYLIDTYALNVPRYIAVYLVAGVKGLALIDSGPSSVAGRVVEAVKGLGFNVNDVKYIVLTHAHMDHAGGAGLLVRDFKEAKVVVYERVVKHLVNPVKLYEGFKSLFGEELTSRYGFFSPVPADLIIPVKGGEMFDLGGVALTVISTPGHTPHELSITVGSGSIFVGDAVGLYLPDADYYLPATPPGFNYEQYLKDMEFLKGLNPKKLYFAHFGSPPNPLKAIDECVKTVEEWRRYVIEKSKAGFTLEQIVNAKAEEIRVKAKLPFELAKLLTLMNVTGLTAK